MRIKVTLWDWLTISKESRGSTYREMAESNAERRFRKEARIFAEEMERAKVREDIYRRTGQQP